MTRCELAERLCEKMPGKSRREVEKMVAVIFEEISHAFAQGKRVELRGFGCFSVKKRDQRMGIDPRTGRSISVESRYAPFFKSGKSLFTYLNSN